jgi:hypothetical protein
MALVLENEMNSDIINKNVVNKDFINTLTSSLGKISNSNNHNLFSSSEHMAVYPHLFKFRKEQLRLGVDLNGLSALNWGLVSMEKCHHVSTTSSGGVLSFRVRVCKTCCRDEGHIELGTYCDQESAILVNDSHEIMNNRHEKLAFLRKEDESHLYLLSARKFDRSNRGSRGGGLDRTNILELLTERLAAVDFKKTQRKRALSMPASGVSYNNAVTPLPGKSSITPSSSITYNELSSSIPDEMMFPTSEASTRKFRNPYRRKLSIGSVSTNGSGHTSSPSVGTNSPISPPSFSGNIDILNTEFGESVSYTEAGSSRVNQSQTGVKVEKKVYRPRAASFSYFNRAEPPPNATNPMDTLSWLAGMGDEEVTALKCLTNLAKSDVKTPHSKSGSDNNNEENGYEYEEDDDEENKDFDINDEHRLKLLKTNNYEYVSNYDYSTVNNDYTQSNNGRLYGAPSSRFRSNSVPDLHLINTTKLRERSDSLSSQRELIGTPGYIGIYSPGERKKRLERFEEKKKHRVWAKKVKYDVRKNFADSRVRVKGRFVRKEDEVN